MVCKGVSWQPFPRAWLCCERFRWRALGRGNRDRQAAACLAIWLDERQRTANWHDCGGIRESRQQRGPASVGSAHAEPRGACAGSRPTGRSGSRERLEAVTGQGLLVTGGRPSGCWPAAASQQQVENASGRAGLRRLLLGVGLGGCAAFLQVVYTYITGGRPACTIRHLSPPATPRGAARQTLRAGRPAARILGAELPPLRQAHLLLCRPAASRSRAVLAAHPQSCRQDPQPLHPCLASRGDLGTDRRVPAPAAPGCRTDRGQRRPVSVAAQERHQRRKKRDLLT